jgi:two-component system, OmpR family, phosphate regulon sensor histidine kinase PhoR
VKASKIWFGELRRVALLLTAALAVGWLLGYPLVALTVTMFAILGHWLYQLWRIQQWLSQPETEPPEGSSIWGDVFDRIYHLRRKEKQAREQLQSAVDYLRNSFASMHDGTVMVDNSGAIQWSNSAAESLLGLRFPEDSGQGILNLVRDPAFHQYFIGGDFSESLSLNTGAESDRFLQIDITHFGDGDRLVFVRDVTNITRMESMRRDFVANVSHELRTPLTVISGYLDTILDNTEALEPRYTKALQQMSQQAARMEALLKDLLWLSRIESVQSIGNHKSVDMRALLEEIRDEVTTIQPQRRLNLSVSTDETVVGDYRELHSAISNLVLNAIKYSPDDSEVSVGWHKDGESCRLSVRDTGQGIAAAHLPRLTERFYRVDDSRSSATGGTGIGLAIVKHVAASHNARLDIDSVYGVGSDFSLVFPATTESA